MDFFERMGKKISDAGQGVSQQAKNLMEVSQLNSSISENERKITQLYQLMGQLYYEKHKNDAAAEEKDKLDEISRLYDEIFQQKEKIKEIKGIVKCMNCGAEVVSNSAFCNVCGAKMQSAFTANTQAASGRICPNCQALVGDNDAFCMNCGIRL